MWFDARRILGDVAPRRPYKPTQTRAATTTSDHDDKAAQASNEDDMVVKGLHWGQRKLLLAEVEFLTAVMEARSQRRAQSAVAPVLVVYAGAAPGLHLPLLFRLFPRVRFVLIDPAPFSAEVRACASATTTTTTTSSTRTRDDNADGVDAHTASGQRDGSDGPVLELLCECCTDALCARLARSYGAHYDILLISDIRSGNPYLTRSNDEHTVMVLRDSAQQASWCHVLAAHAALLKFHPPYPAKPHNSRDETATAASTMTYLDGTALFGVWSPKSSSEVRLVPHGPFTASVRDCATRTTAAQRVYDCLQHEEQCYHYNTTDRYARDVLAERIIWERYVRVCTSDAGATVATAASYRGSDEEECGDKVAWLVRALAGHVSDALRHSLFRPLDAGYAEHHARWAYMIYSARALSATAAAVLHARYKHCMTREVVRALVHTYATASQCPREVRVGDVVLSEDVWRVLCRGNLVEAYSLAPVRWSFDMAQPQRRRLLCAGNVTPNDDVAAAAAAAVAVPQRDDGSDDASSSPLSAPLRRHDKRHRSVST